MRPMGETRPRRSPWRWSLPGTRARGSKVSRRPPAAAQRSTVVTKEEKAAVAPVGPPKRPRAWKAKGPTGPPVHVASARSPAPAPAPGDGPGPAAAQVTRGGTPGPKVTVWPRSTRSMRSARPRRSISASKSERGEVNTV